MVVIASEFSNSIGGGLGNGSSERVHCAVGLKDREEPGSIHMDFCRYLGHLGNGSVTSAILSSMSSFSASVTNVVPSTFLFRLAALPFIPFVAGFVLFPALSSPTLTSAVFFRSSRYD